MSKLRFSIVLTVSIITCVFTADLFGMDQDEVQLNQINKKNCYRQNNRRFVGCGGRVVYRRVQKALRCIREFNSQGLRRNDEKLANLYEKIIDLIAAESKLGRLAYVYISQWTVQDLRNSWETEERSYCRKNANRMHLKVGLFDAFSALEEIVPLFSLNRVGGQEGAFIIEDILTELQNTQKHIIQRVCGSSRS